MIRLPYFSAALFAFTSWESISPQSPTRCRLRIPLNARATFASSRDPSVSACIALSVIPTVPSEKSGAANTVSIWSAISVLVLDIVVRGQSKRGLHELDFHVEPLDEPPLLLMLGERIHAHVIPLLVGKLVAPALKRSLG